MSLRYFVVLLLLYIVIPSLCRSQTLEQNIFSELSKALCKINENTLLKKELEGLVLLEDVDGTQYLRFVNKSGPNDSTAFKKYGFKRCVEILNSPDLKVFPLKDTVEILDSNRLFSELDYRCDSIFFRTEYETNIKAEKTSRLFIYRTGFRGNCIFISLCSPKSNQIIDFEFTVEASGVKFKKLTGHTKEQERRGYE